MCTLSDRRNNGLGVDTVRVLTSRQISLVFYSRAAFILRFANPILLSSGLGADHQGGGGSNAAAQVARSIQLAANAASSPNYVPVCEWNMLFSTWCFSTWCDRTREIVEGRGLFDLNFPTLPVFRVHPSQRRNTRFT